MTEKKAPEGNLIERMFSVGAHFGYSKKRRHPSALPYIFGVKGSTEIIDLEQTERLLAAAREFVRGLGKEGKIVLFVGSKYEARDVVRLAADRLGMPYVASRWIGGTLTNYAEMKKRIERLQSLLSDREKGVLAERYTKRELLTIDREIVRLEQNFTGLVPMKERLPHAVVVVDPLFEKIAVAEAQKIGVPIIALANSDCDISNITYPILANDGTVESIKFFIDELKDAYEDGVKNKVQ